MARILSIAPYKYLKPQNGGHWGLYFVETIYAKKNEVLTIGVEANEEYPTTFQQKNILTNSKKRYIPWLIKNTIAKVASSYQPTHITCHHHYLFPAAYAVAKTLNIPIYIRAHNIENERFKSIGKWWWKGMFYFERYAYRRATTTFFISNQDADWAMKNFGLSANKATVMPFATPFASIPSSEVRRDTVARLHQLDSNKEWLIFMGILSYEPNEDAVRLLIEEIYPRLKAQNNNFELIICGKGLKVELVQQIKELENSHYLGFVDDLEALLHQSKVMLNPVVNGGGVKTKVLEALAWNNAVVSTYFGAFGVEEEYCGDKLKLVTNDWDQFAAATLSCIQNPKQDIPARFFEHYNIDKIAERMQKYFS